MEVRPQPPALNAGMTQEYLERVSRWWMGTGFLLADDMLQDTPLDDPVLIGSYMYHFDKPYKCTFISYGAGGTWVPDFPATTAFTISKSECEQSKITNFIWKIDPENKFGVRARYYHIDIKESKLVRRPSDEEIAKMHAEYARENSTKCATKRSKISASTTLESIASAINAHHSKARGANPSMDEQIMCELKKLDGRRMHDCNIQPPAERRDVPTTQTMTQKRVSVRSGGAKKAEILDTVLKTMQRLHRPRVRAKSAQHQSR